MVMTIERKSDGSFRVRQRLIRPAIYLDHWAIRLFSSDKPLQDRFVDAIHRSGATWLFSAANLFEFVAMTDLAQAVETEELLQRVIPSLHVADTTLDRGFLLEDGAPAHPDAPDPHWLLRDLGDRASIKGGNWNTHRFIQDAITGRDALRPLFDALKTEVSQAIAAQVGNADAVAVARKFRPTAGMTLRDALTKEVMRDLHVDTHHAFNENDAMDLVHAVPAVIVCDLVLLDAAWCSKVEKASKRMRAGGVTGKVAKCYSRSSLASFLSDLEAWGGH